MSEFAERARELAEAWADSRPASGDPLAKMVWEEALRSLGALRSVLDATPHAAEERELLETYAQTHVALLEALKTGRRR